MGKIWQKSGNIYVKRFSAYKLILKSLVNEKQFANAKVVYFKMHTYMFKR